MTHFDENLTRFVIEFMLKASNIELTKPIAESLIQCGNEALTSPEKHGLEHFDKRIIQDIITILQKHSTEKPSEKHT